MPSFSSFFNAPSTPTGVPVVTDLIGRSCKVLVEFNFIPLFNAIFISGLEKKKKRTISFCDNDGNIRKITARSENEPLVIKMLAIPFVKEKLNTFYESGQTFTVHYQVFGDTLIPIPIQFGTGTECQIIGLGIDDINVNSDGPVVMTVSVEVGSWL